MNEFAETQADRLTAKKLHWLLDGRRRLGDRPLYWP